MSNTAQRWLALKSGVAPIDDMGVLIPNKNSGGFSLTWADVERWAALEAQAPAVAELVRAARRIALDGWTGHAHLERLRRALEPFAEVE